MSNEWKEVKLGDICDFQKGYAFKSKDYQEYGRKIIKVSNLNNYNVDLNNCICIDESKANYYQQYELCKDDVIITTVGSWPSNPNSVVGKVIKVQKEVEKSLLNQNAVRVKGLNDISQKYLFFALKHKKFFYYIVGTAQGAANQASITQNDIKNYQLHLPPFSEQIAIAKTLSCLDDKIELNNCINKTLEEMAQAIFKSWFVDFEPFQDGEFEDSEMGRIPKGWRAAAIEEISQDIICGKTPSTKDKENYGDFMPFITIPDMHGNIYVTKTERYLSQKGVNTQSNKILPKNSVVVSCIATPGLVTLTSENSQTNQQINSIICKENISFLYMFLCMKNYSSKIRDLGSGGSTTLNLNKTQFSKIKFILPSEEVLNEFHQLVDSLFNNILENEIQKQNLISIRDSLLSKLMSGEIRVPTEEVQ